MLKPTDLVTDGTLRVYLGAPRGVYGEHQASLDEVVLGFLAQG
ncbi:hypothetical protein [Curtobacterium flaccumfaciens]|nr:hypothetical protein [Curtobacterium flaccumfaciens]MCS5495169.1 hypothetical protein [Curtobacterium flaccumfaciens pv. flaccumfaciens]